MRPFTRREKLALLRHQLSKAQTPEQFKEIFRLIEAEEAKGGMVGILMGRSQDAY